MPTYSACSRYCPVIEETDDCGEPTMDDWESQPLPVAVTGLSKKELSFEESQLSTIGEANQRRRGRKTGSTCGRYRPVKEGAVD
nr:unnamed protein product [Spirometra erinaceieuropaei]